MSVIACVWIDGSIRDEDNSGQIKYFVAEWAIPALSPAPKLWKTSIFLPSLFNVRPTVHPQTFKNPN